MSCDDNLPRKEDFNQTDEDLVLCHSGSNEYYKLINVASMKHFCHIYLF